MLDMMHGKTEIKKEVLMNNSLLILGAGGLGQVVAEMAMGQYNRIAFLDDEPKEDKQELYPIIGGLQSLEDVSRNFTYAIPAYGNAILKEEIRKRIIACGLIMPLMIHPTAIISPSAKIGAGAIIRENAVISRKVIIGECVLINIGVLIDHGCEIGDCSHLPMGMIVRNERQIPRCSTFKPGEILE